MKPVNLYEFSKSFVLSETPLTVYEKFNSKRDEAIQIKRKEIETIEKCIFALSDFVGLENWDGFYYSFSIPQISKEFDLLKLGDAIVLNLELKSEFTSNEKLLKQLVRNNYYLSHLDKKIIEIVYVADKNIFYLLEDNRLVEITVASVAKFINGIDNFYDDEIEVLFRPSQFLVSPINTPEKFINGNYFLTDHQEEIKSAIIKSTKDNKTFKFFQVVGGAGTGKTLLIYDIAKQFSKILNVCVVHCAYLADGHDYLNKNLDKLEIISIKDLKDLHFDKYDGFIIDEAHRLYREQFQYICEKVKTLNKFCVFGMDGEQYLTKTEQKNNINEEVSKLERCEHYRLTAKIRTNKELADFIHILRNISIPVETKSFPNVKIIYADNYDYANRLIKSYEKQEYKYISFTPSTYVSHNIDKLLRAENTHHVIGQEFDKVLMVINESFEYLEDGRLGAYEHPYPNYLFAQLLYQGLTRVREKLAIIILNNKTLFEKLLRAIDSAANK